MLPFSLTQWRYVILALFVGTILVILLYFAYHSRYYGIFKKRDSENEEEFPEGIKVGKKPLPIFLLLIYIILGIWGIAYTIIIAMNGLKF